jgi:hypothetical protein
LLVSTSGVSHSVGQDATARRAGGPQRGLCARLAAEAAAEVNRLAGVATRAAAEGDDLEPPELAIGTAMTRVGARLLEDQLAADDGHRGRRTGCRASHAEPDTRQARAPESRGENATQILLRNSTEGWLAKARPTAEAISPGRPQGLNETR